MASFPRHEREVDNVPTLAALAALLSEHQHGQHANDDHAHLDNASHQTSHDRLMW